MIPGQILKNIDTEDWSPWSTVRVVSVSLFGDVEVVPSVNGDSFTSHTFTKAEAREKLVLVPKEVGDGVTS